MRLEKRKWIILLSGGAALLAIAILTIGAYIILNRPDEPETYQDYIRMAEDYAVRGDLVSATGSYWKAIEVDSTETAAYLGLGKIYEEKSETKQARQVYEAGVKNTGDEELEQQLQRVIDAQNQAELVQQVQQDENLQKTSSVAGSSSQAARTVGGNAANTIRNSRSASNQNDASYDNMLASAGELPKDREDPDGDIDGIVTDEDGTAIGGAEVCLESQDTDEMYVQMTDVEGKYQLSDIDNGDYIMTVTASGYQNYKRSVVLAGGGRIRIDITLCAEEEEDPIPYEEEIGTIQGIVRAEDYSPIAGAQVTLVSNEDADLILTAITEEDGRYRLETVERGNYEMTVTADGYEEFRTNVDVAANSETTADVTLAAVQSGGSSDSNNPPDASGQSANEEPIPDNSPGEPTHEEPTPGEPTHEEPTPEEPTPEEPTPEEPTPEEPTPEAPEPEEEPVQDTYCVSGVVSSEEEEPVEGAEVTLIPEGKERPEDSDAWITVETDRDGAYRLEEIPAGTYTLKVTESGFEEMELTITVTDEDVTEDVVLTWSDEMTDGE